MLWRYIILTGLGTGAVLHREGPKTYTVMLIFLLHKTVKLMFSRYEELHNFSIHQILRLRN
jgi:hypothetical protein